MRVCANPTTPPTAVGTIGDVPQYAEIPIAEGTYVRLELTEIGDAPPAVGGSQGDTDLPPGITGSVPVGRGGAVVAAMATDTLHQVLRPLGPLLQEVHDAVSAIKEPPQEMNVQFGVQIGQDLKLGIVGVGGHGSLTVSATWRTTPPTE
jgi:hypothetical protein